MSIDIRSRKRTLHYSLLSAVLLLACGLVFASCDLVNGNFLDRPARGAVSSETLTNKEGGIETVLISAYAALNQQAKADFTASIGGGAAWESSQDNWVYGSVAGGEAYKGSESGDQGVVLTIAQMQHDPSVGYFNTKWKALFEGISRANNALRLVDEAEVSESERTRIEAEARFLRGHFYFDLKRNFGNVPWVSDTTENFNQPNTGENAPDVWAKIEQDFQFAKENLPNTPSDVGRAYRWAAQAYLGKTYLYQEKWQEALAELEAVINMGNNAKGEALALTPKYQDMFNPATENNSGSIFAIQNTGPDGSGAIGNARGGSVLNYPHGGASPFICCGFFQPSQWFVNAFRVDAQGHPANMDEDDPRSVGTPVKSDQGVAANQPFTLGTQTLDPRLDWTVGRRGVPYLDWGPHPGNLWIREQATGGPYSPKKHVYRRANRDQFGANNAWGATGSAVNYEIIRFADVLLMAAEAKAELNQGDLGRSYVNRVRERAQGDAVTNSLNEAFALAVVDSESAMLATEPSQYDWVVRTDRNSTFVFIGEDGDDPGDLSNWNEYQLPNYNVQPYNAFAGQQDALQKIRYERMLELGMEGHRFYDIARWGIADSQLDSYYNYEVTTDAPGDNLAGGDFTPDKNEVFPIPQ
ncbi:MAG: RagB/SusD family nutrient uptake outer membrane protein, partial [Bacteroidetes bacterium]|nr:RagB/SusD family nutrient uptake outer membrane protein [Bacteroidota bacterium]